LLELIHRALLRRLVRPPSHDLRSAAETLARHVVVADLHHDSSDSARLALCRQA
jgi:hypothetical protein